MRPVVTDWLGLPEDERLPERDGEPVTVTDAVPDTEAESVPDGVASLLCVPDGLGELVTELVAMPLNVAVAEAVCDEV